MKTQSLKENEFHFLIQPVPIPENVGRFRAYDKAWGPIDLGLEHCTKMSVIEDFLITRLSKEFLRVT